MFPCEYFLKNIFTFSRQSQTEIFGYDTKAITVLMKLGKLTNCMKNNVLYLEITNNI